MGYPRWILLGFVISMTACASDPGQFTPLTTALPDVASLHHQAASPEIELLWTCAAPGPQGTEVNGLVRNVGERQVQAVGLEAQSVRADRFTSRQTARGVPSVMLFGQSPAPFRVELPLKSAADRIDLFIAYAVTPAPWIANRTEPQQTLAIEDACSPDRHLRVAAR